MSHTAEAAHRDLLTASHPGDDRRLEPRIVLGLPVVVRTPNAAASGRMVDVSLGGIQVELLGPLPSPGREVVVDLSLSGREPTSMRGAIVRRSLSPDGRVLIALRFLHGEPDTRVFRGQPAAMRSPSPRPAPRGSEERNLAVRQLRALGARLLELALEDGDAAPPMALVTWVGRLAGELGVQAPEDVGTNRALFRGIADMHRRASIRVDGATPAPEGAVAPTAGSV